MPDHPLKSIAAMTFVLTKPQQELVPILQMTQFSASNSSNSSNSGSSGIGSGSGSGMHNRSHGSAVPMWTVRPSKKRRRNKSSRCCLVGLSVGLLVILPYLFSSFSTLGKIADNLQTTKLKPAYEQQHISDSDDSADSNNGKVQDQENAAVTTANIVKRLRKPKTDDGTGARATASLVWGTVGTDNIPYYHQPATSPTEENQHIVLLHGSAFTKEDWKSSGILDLFRENFPSITLTALDLPVSAGHDSLERVLRSMRDEDLIQQLPISALVTPSASGKTITTWITEESSNGLSSYISAWIPVASYSVKSCSAKEISTLLDQQPDLSVLAIYGSKDRNGKKVTQMLKDYAGAKTLELTGGHPAYLDSSEAFVQAVGNLVLVKE